MFLIALHLFLLTPFKNIKFSMTFNKPATWLNLNCALSNLVQAKHTFLCAGERLISGGKPATITMMYDASVYLLAQGSAIQCIQPCCPFLQGLGADRWPHDISWLPTTPRRWKLRPQSGLCHWSQPARFSSISMLILTWVFWGTLPWVTPLGPLNLNNSTERISGTHWPFHHFQGH